MNCRVCASLVPQDQIRVRDPRKGPVYKCPSCSSVLLVTETEGFIRIFSGPTDGDSLPKRALALIGAKADLSRFVQRHYFDWLSRNADLSRVRSVLDVGCGDGTLLSELARGGRRILGYEASRAKVSVSPIRKYLINDYFDQATVLDEKFDLIVMGQNISYFYDSLGILAKVDGSLAEGGYLFITTANTDDPRILDGVQLHAPTILSRDAITNFLERRSYRVVKTELCEPRNTLRGWRRLLKRFPLSIHLHNLYHYVILSLTGPYEVSSQGYHLFILAQKSAPNK